MNKTLYCFYLTEFWSSPFPTCFYVLKYDKKVNPPPKFHTCAINELMKKS